MPPSPRAEEVDAGWRARHPLPDVADLDKYERGTVVVIGGSPTTPGAVLLAGRAALLMGAGRLRIATSAETSGALAIACPEAQVLPVRTDDDGSLLRPDDAWMQRVVGDADVVVIGPGLEPRGVDDLLEAVAGAISDRCRLVLDAAAIGAWSDVAQDDRTRLRGRLLMTPNEIEAAIAAGEPGEGRDQAQLLSEVSTAHGAVVTSFGLVVAPDERRFVVRVSHAGLGTSGSGDVLAGLVAGAAARCGDPAIAACWATFAHASLGRRQVEQAPFGAYPASSLLLDPVLLHEPGDELRPSTVRFADRREGYAGPVTNAEEQS